LTPASEISIGKQRPSELKPSRAARRGQTKVADLISSIIILSSLFFFPNTIDS
jgi:hypothetical protein